MKPLTLYPMKYAHGFVVLGFAVVYIVIFVEHCEAFWPVQPSNKTQKCYLRVDICRDVLNTPIYHWNRNVVILTIFASLTARVVVILTTYGATSGEKMSSKWQKFRFSSTPLQIHTNTHHNTSFPFYDIKRTLSIDFAYKYWQNGNCYWMPYP